VEKISGGIEVDVPVTYCDPEDTPVDEEECKIYCNDECVLSEWSPWSACGSVKKSIF